MSSEFRHPKTGRRATVVYPYRSADGSLLYEKGRWDSPDGTKTFLLRAPDPDRSGGWKLDLDGVSRVLYRQPDLHTATDDLDVLFIAEGEKDVDRLVAAGLLATTNDAGARSPFPENWIDECRGFRQVVFFEDNDHAGRELVGYVPKSSLRLPPCKTSESWGFPELGEHSDVSDFLDQGGTLQELWRRVETAEQVRPAPARSSHRSASRPQYDITSEGIFLENGQSRSKLTNFAARILSDISINDGLEDRREIEVEVSQNGRVGRTTPDA